MKTIVMTRNERNIDEMQKRVTDKRTKKSLIRSALESVKYIALIVIFMVISLGISFAISAVVTGDMFNVFTYRLEQPVMCGGALAAMFLIKKEGKVVFPKSQKLSGTFYLGLFLVGFASISAYAYFLLGIVGNEVHFDLGKQIASIVVAPICEEFICRYLLTAAIRKNKEGIHMVALVVTALAFTMMHSPSAVYNFARLMVAALFIGYIYQKTGSYKGCVLHHLGSNIGATCIYLIANNFGKSVKLSIAVAFTAVTILGVIIVIKEMRKAGKKGE